MLRLRVAVTLSEVEGRVGHAVFSIRNFNSF